MFRREMKRLPSLQEQCSATVMRKPSSVQPSRAWLDPALLICVTTRNGAAKRTVGSLAIMPEPSRHNRRCGSRIRCAAPPQRARRPRQRTHPDRGRAAVVWYHHVRQGGSLAPRRRRGRALSCALTYRSQPRREAVNRPRVRSRAFRRWRTGSVASRCESRARRSRRCD
jgi:hypothetical protein